MIKHGTMKTIIPFGPYTIGGGCTATIIVQPQTWVRVHRLWVSRETGAAFMLGDIKVGKNSQFASVAEFSMAVFDNDQLHEPGTYPDPCIGVVSPVVYVGFLVRNRLPVSAVFSGHMEGLMVDPDKDENPEEDRVGGYVPADEAEDLALSMMSPPVTFYCKECGATRKSVGVPEKPCSCGSKDFEVAP